MKGTDLQPGYVTSAKLQPLHPGVGKWTGHRITFSTTHSISNNGRIVIHMPVGMQLCKQKRPGASCNGTVIKIKPVDGTIKARQGVVVNSNQIMINDVFGTTYKRSKNNI